jgi:hypothetical protein
MNPSNENSDGQRFEASRLWQSNVYGAAVAGIAGMAFFCAIAGTMIYMSQSLDVLLLAGGLVASGIIGLLLMYPGNEIAVYPYAVELEEGKGLRLLAPLKTVYIPIEEVKGIRSSLLALGWIVSFSRRHGLLKGFVIHGGFGGQGVDLARAIQEEIARRGQANG